MRNKFVFGNIASNCHSWHVFNKENTSFEMLSIDVTDVVYSFLSIVSTMVAMTLLVFSAIGLFYPSRPKSSSARFQTYSYVVMSVNVFILELTYLVPASMPSFTANLNLCIAFGATQHFVENFAIFFVIGMSMCVLLHVSPGYRKCQCRDTNNIGKSVFLFWVPVGGTYSLFFTIFGLCEKLFGVSTNRCWIVKGPGNMDYFSYQWISYRTLAIAVFIMTLIYAILCSIQFKKRAKICNDIYQTMDIQDKVGKKEMVDSLNKLDKTLLRQYMILTMICVSQEIISISTYLIGNNIPKGQTRAYFGWSDAFYVITCFLFVEIFIENSLTKMINIIWDRCTKMCRHDDDRILPNTYGEEMAISKKVPY